MAGNEMETVDLPIRAAGAEVNGAGFEVRIAGSAVVTAADEVETAGPEVEAADPDVTTAPPVWILLADRSRLPQATRACRARKSTLPQGRWSLTLTVLRLPGPKSFRPGTRLSLPVTKCPSTSSRFASSGQNSVSP
jgi:hypothetical protein